MLVSRKSSALQYGVSLIVENAYNSRNKWRIYENNLSEDYFPFQIG